MPLPAPLDPALPPFPLEPPLVEALLPPVPAPDAAAPPFASGCSMLALQAAQASTAQRAPLRDQRSCIAQTRIDEWWAHEGCYGKDVTRRAKTDLSHLVCAQKCEWLQGLLRQSWRQQISIGVSGHALPENTGETGAVCPSAVRVAAIHSCSEGPATFPSPLPRARRSRRFLS